MKKLLNLLSIFGLSVTPVTAVSCGVVTNDEWITKDITINISMSNAPTIGALRNLVQGYFKVNELAYFISNCVKKMNDYNFQENIVIGKTTWKDLTVIISGHFIEDGPLKELWDAAENSLSVIMLYVKREYSEESSDDPSNTSDYVITRYLVARFNITKENA
ncbi:hypothetical protein [Spiroplasma endosymbiont of Labia minor]|uniref:hypothetical protein n=1 Tax=Spiroplasma endosymbiont of Labia minor TaxID=3066305 RepID=UPI0030D1CE0A